MNDEKIINFSIGELRIGDNIFDLSIFDRIEEKERDIVTMDDDILSAVMINKNIIENRYITFDFEFYEKYPYPPKVLKMDKKKAVTRTDNPRSADNIEPKDHLFVLIDSETQKIYISDRRKTDEFIAFIHKSIKHNIIIAPIIEEKDFLENIKSVNEISLTVIRDQLFNTATNLSAKLAESIHYFNADEISLDLKYKNGIGIAEVRDKIKTLLGNKLTYKKLTIQGRNTKTFETIFNLDGVINKLPIKTVLEEKTKRVVPEKIFELLIIKIKQNEETK